MDTFLFWYFSALFYVQDNWWFLLEFAYLAYGLYHVPDFYTYTLNEIKRPEIAARIGGISKIVFNVAMIPIMALVVIFLPGLSFIKIIFCLFKTKKD